MNLGVIAMNAYSVFHKTPELEPVCECVNALRVVGVYVCIYSPTPPRTSRKWHKVSFLSGGWQVWIQSFPSRLVAIPSLEIHSLPYNLLLIKFIFFSRVLVLCKIQAALFKIWILFVMSVSNDNNSYTMNVCMYLYMYVCVWVCVCYEYMYICVCALCGGM